METPETIRTSLQVGEWVTSIDFKDAYFHISIQNQSRKYLSPAYTNSSSNLSGVRLVGQYGKIGTGHQTGLRLCRVTSSTRKKARSDSPWRVGKRRVGHSLRGTLCKGSLPESKLHINHLELKCALLWRILTRCSRK